MKLYLIKAFLLFFCAPAVFAQCATGVDTGGGACIPPDASGMPDSYGTQGNQPVQTQSVFETRWGAIVFGVDKPVEGSVDGFPEKEAAVSAATSICASKGAKTCQLKMAYFNTCVAIAWGSHGNSINTATLQDVANARALKNCNSLTDNCKIVHAGCSTPQRIR